MWKKINVRFCWDILSPDVHVTVHRDKSRIIKPTTCTDFPNLFLEWNSTCFGQFLCPSSGVLHCTHSCGICHTDCEQDQDGTKLHPDPACKLSANLYDIYHRCVQWKTPDDGQRICSKHVECYFKNNFEKLVHLFGFIIPYPTAFPYGNGMVLHFYQQQESSTTKTVHKVINKRLKTYV